MFTPLTIMAAFFGLFFRSSVGPYPITGNSVNCRSGPGTRFGSIRQYNKNNGDTVTIICQVEGEEISGTKLWDRTTDECYVSNSFVNTGTNDYVAPKCDENGNPITDGCCTTVNEVGLDFLKEQEGFVPSPAPDPIGLPTVGYGHKCQKPGCAELSPKYTFPLTRETASSLLNDDISVYAKCLCNALDQGKASLNDNQWAALVSWTFNIGCGGMSGSTLIRRLNGGEDPNTVAGEELPKWNKGGGRVLPGLVRRRAAEVVLFNTPSTIEAYPACSG